MRRPYRIDFALIVITGNLARYKTLRPLVERDTTVAARWYPIRTWIEGDPLRFLPGALRLRGRHLLDSWRLFVRSPADAVVIHAFETYPLYCLIRSLHRWRTIVVQNPDGPLAVRAGIRGWPMRHAIRSTALFLPWSSYAAEEIRKAYPELPGERIQVLHPGVDLEQWTLRSPRPVCYDPDRRFKILFVGGDLPRKGINTLLDAFEMALTQSCELHIATQSLQLDHKVFEQVQARVASLPAVFLHIDLKPNSPELRRLYTECDVFVLPTNRDFSPIVSLEAMATGIPVITTWGGGISDIVCDGETGLLMRPRDPAALAEAIERLRLDPSLRERLARQARRHVEEHFDAHKNTLRLLDLVKHLVDNRRSGLGVGARAKIVP